MSGSTEYSLPFRRGSTYKDGSTLTMSATVGESIVGRVYKTTDDDGKDLWLRAVRADAALTNIGGKCVAYTAGYTGQNVSALATSSGEVCSPVDQAYSITFDVTQYDIFYVVDAGYVDCAPESDVSAGDPVMVHTNSNVITATSGKYIIGIAQETYASASTNLKKVLVNGTLKPSDPAT